MLKNVPSATLRTGQSFCYGRDSKCRETYCMHWSMACKMYMIPAHVTGWGFHSCTWQDSLKKKHLVLQFLFVKIYKKKLGRWTFCIEPIILNGIENVVPTSLQFIWRCSQNCGLLLPFDKSSTWSLRESTVLMLYLKKNPYLHNEGIKAILNTDQTAALYWVMNKELSHYWNV